MSASVGYQSVRDGTFDFQQGNEPPSPLSLIYPTLLYHLDGGGVQPFLVFFVTLCASQYRPMPSPLQVILRSTGETAIDSAAPASDYDSGENLS